MQRTRKKQMWREINDFGKRKNQLVIKSVIINNVELIGKYGNMDHVEIIGNITYSSLWVQ